MIPTKQQRALQDLKMQAQANSEETVFVAKTAGTDRKFLGDSSTHAGNFVSQANVQGALNTGWSWSSTSVEHTELAR